MPIFAWNVSLVSLIFLKRSLLFPILLFPSVSLHCSLRKAFIHLLAILWNSGTLELKQIDCVLSSLRWGTSIQSANKVLGADCGSGHQFLIAKLSPKLKKVGITTRPFWYDLNQILCDYTVEVMNRFKGLDLVDRVSEQKFLDRSL